MEAIQITDSVVQLRGNSNAYCLLTDEPILIDTGDPASREDLREALAKHCSLSSIKHVVLTHLHYDHVANWDLFLNATCYAHASEIAAFKNDPQGTVLDPHVTDTLSRCDLKDISHATYIHQFLEVMHTPGHTVGSICLHYPGEGLLFTGDTLFWEGMVGRTDLPSSLPQELDHSLAKIASYKKCRILPGHDY